MPPKRSNPDGRKSGRPEQLASSDGDDEEVQELLGDSKRKPTAKEQQPKQQSSAPSKVMPSPGAIKTIASEAETVSEAPEGTELDSVDERFGDFSETIRDEIRALDKAAWEESDPSMDPLSDIDTFIDYGLPLPPQHYDALQAVGAEALEELESIKGAGLTPEAQARVQYRMQLVDGVAPADQQWLKLRAYHRASERLRAERAAAKAGPARREELLAFGAPLDVVPQVR